MKSEEDIKKALEVLEEVHWEEIHKSWEKYTPDNVGLKRTSVVLKA